MSCNEVPAAGVRVRAINLFNIAVGMRERSYNKWPAAGVRVRTINLVNIGVSKIIN